ncbi:hypothetical protein DPMN_176045 [Dreissena polymorpha]|uniref:Uncharacterized protein n=1 Tax=Dreissena polymorpha TaxID=45954 RepID=A0A9D4E980_DREPO|nr:hypothetical protein DPMN_176045 [Dreissena polymorpha]
MRSILEVSQQDDSATLREEIERLMQSNNYIPGSKTEDWDMEIRLSEIKKTVTPKTEDWDAEIAVAKRPPFFLSVGKMTQRQINRLNRCWTCRCVPVNCTCSKY